MKSGLKKKIGQLFMLGVPTEGITDEAAELYEKYYIGNFTLNANDCASLDMLCKLNGELREHTYRNTGIYPFVEVDQEGGWVTRIYEGAAMISGAMSFAASGADEAKMKKTGAKIGKILRALGCNANTAPVLDVNINPDNPIIGTRSYGEDPEKVASLGRGFSDGLQSEGVMAVVKHFPGHGNVVGDTHLNIVHNSTDADTLRKTEYVPFQKVFDAKCGGIMTAHVIHDAFSKTPSTLSPEIMTELLRNEMRFDGVAITDAMGMKAISEPYPNGEAAVKAILAGCDILLYYTYDKEAVEKAVNAVYKAIEEGVITEARINKSYERIMKQKKRFDVASSAPDIELAKKLIYNEADKAENFADKLASITCIKDDGVLKSLSGKKILCISPICDAIRGVEEANRQILSFADIFAEEFENSITCVSSLEGMTPEAEEAINGEYDVAVVGVFDAASMPGQLDIIKALEEKGKPTVAVLLRTPYDYKFVKNCDAVIASYEYTKLSAKATAVAIRNCDYRGKLPVTLPGKE
ncbi:MAG: glycoside hydrolase family 3 protein [Ruminococcaceae bacterium]|nr:glycoside hydrolase family 3 protein [Oscillospiraceae bacterium]